MIGKNAEGYQINEKTERSSTTSTFCRPMSYLLDHYDSSQSSSWQFIVSFSFAELIHREYLVCASASDVFGAYTMVVKSSVSLYHAPQPQHSSDIIVVALHNRELRVKYPEFRYKYEELTGYTGGKYLTAVTQLDIDTYLSSYTFLHNSQYQLHRSSTSPLKGRTHYFRLTLQRGNAGCFFSRPSHISYIICSYSGGVPCRDNTERPGDPGNVCQDEDPRGTAPGLPKAHSSPEGVPLRQGGTLQHASSRR
ncbi:unnamed protein product [Nesidiocoris tenuis]|uniref:Uncharacterized protein n=1 Tax=Nesidiocoris tenuis TaxID=355587 RepID=A0A6H5GIM7_9HEMI|nr:unnamed protein product [Nesidiocoris tenuis]